MPSFFERLKYKVFSSISSFLKTDEYQELLKKVNTHLLIWNQQMVNLETGLTTDLADYQAETLAQAASGIITKDKQTPHIILYLANTEFVATEYVLPEVAEQNIPAALQFQLDGLLPGYPGELLLAVRHNNTLEKNLALWFDLPRANDLYNALHAQGIELTAIIPRIFLALSKAEKGKEQQIREQDDTGLLHVGLEQGCLKQWGAITTAEMDDKDYFLQWQSLFGEAGSVPCFQTLEAWQGIDLEQFLQIRYAFFPESARLNLQKRSRLKKGRLGVIVGVIFALLIAKPFVDNVLRYKKWERRYLEYVEDTKEVRKMRAAVTQFEDNWSLYIDYPKVDVVTVIKKLNSIIPKNSWVTVFEMKNGVVEIEGYSPNATGILEVISKQPNFSQAAFNQRTRTQRGKNSEHFGITFSLASINMNAYQEKYFPSR
jgi:hypothetical protein